MYDDGWLYYVIELVIWYPHNVFELKKETCLVNLCLLRLKLIGTYTWHEFIISKPSSILRVKLTKSKRKINHDDREKNIAPSFFPCSLNNNHLNGFLFTGGGCCCTERKFTKGCRFFFQKDLLPSIDSDIDERETDKVKG